MDERIAKQFTISKASPVPLYFQLKTQLVELLKQGIFQAGDKLPTEAEFCELLDISRPTVRQAFSELINEGYLKEGQNICQGGKEIVIVNGQAKEK